MLEGNRGAYVPPDGGDSVWLAGIHITVKLTSEDTGGAYAMTEEITPPQGGAPPHTHSQEDETLYVLEGEVEFVLGEDTIPAGAFEGFFFEAGEPAPEGSSPPEGEPDVGRIVEIGQKYGLEIPPPPPG